MATTPQAAPTVPLFTPLTLRGLTLPHRIVVSPMCMYSSEDGFANDWHLVHLGSRAAGGAAMVIFEATGVAPEGRITPACMGIWKDEHIAKLQQIVKFVEARGSVPALQLSHAGRKASCKIPRLGGTALPVAEGGWAPWGPSASKFRPEDNDVHVVSVDEIKQVVAAHAAAARRAIAAGFKALEIHAAHGYFLNEFLSPLCNQRTDEYGGSLENRMRATIETIQAIRAVMPDSMPLMMKISSVDWADGGFTVEESVALAKAVKAAGVDLVTCSSGNVVAHQKPAFAPGFNVPFAELVKKEAGVATGAVGLITTPQQANEIVDGGRADLVLMAREFLRDPYFPHHAAKALGAKIPFPGQYTPAFI